VKAEKGQKEAGHWSERISIINIAAVSCCCARKKNPAKMGNI